MTPTDDAALELGPPVDPIGQVLEELRALRDAVERGIDGAATASDDVAKLRADMVRIEAKSDRRARTFRRSWIGLAAAMLVIVVAGGAGIGWLVHGERVQRQCFQDWAQDTADRTQTLSKASDLRIRALNDVLTIRAAGGSEAQVRAAARVASEAGDAYEQLVRLNPPIAPEAVTCASPTAPPA